MGISGPEVEQQLSPPENPVYDTEKFSDPLEQYGPKEDTSGVMVNIEPMSNSEQSLLGETSQEQVLVFQVIETKSLAELGT